MERAETYTHGHAESVLRSHRWRTVDNSAAYLLPHLGPGASVLDVGSRLRSWAIEAGCSEVTASASAWCYATPDERAWWGGLWADRIAGTALGARAVELGIASPQELPELAEAWHTWAEADDAWFAVLHGEILATP